jgi:hypothetical protein
MVFYSDAGHGWLRVPRNWLYLLKVGHRISSWSYEGGDWVYLEEDCDFPLFLKEYREVIKEDPNIVYSKSVDRARIRGYSRFRWRSYEV